MKTDIETLSKQAAALFPRIPCRFFEPLRLHTSFRIGGPVTSFFSPETEEDFTSLWRYFAASGVAPLIIGNGTNILADDRGLDRVALHTGRLNAVSLIGDNLIQAGCGAALSRIAVFARDKGLSGFEFAHGIPGTLGGAVAMNAGAYGGEIRDVLHVSSVLDKSGKLIALDQNEHAFSYRSSAVHSRELIVLSSTLRLRPGEPADISRTMEELGEKRSGSQPLTLPSAGSFFKRPQNGYAAALIEQAGLKGFRIGDAAVSEKHAGFFVNLGNATFEDMLSLKRRVCETVLLYSGVELFTEVQILWRS